MERLAAQIGYGGQQHPGEFLAVLAMSRVKADYPVRVGKKVGSIADLVAAEKLSCRSGGDLSLKLIGLGYYAAEPQWKNDLGETWSIERMIDEELAHPAAVASEIGVESSAGRELRCRAPSETWATYRGTVRTGQEIRGRLPNPCLADAELRRQLGAVISSCV